MEQKIAIAATIVLVCTVCNANALESGDMLLRLGASTEIPHETTYLNSGSTKEDLALDRSGAGFGSLSYMVTSNVGVGFLITTPFKHELMGHNGSSVLVGDYEVFYAALTAQYHREFGKFKPYVGIGLSEATFMNENANKITFPNDTLHIKHDTSLAYELGFDYKLAEATYVNISTVYMNTDTTAKVRGGLNGNITMKINPVLWNFGLVHKF